MAGIIRIPTPVSTASATARLVGDLASADVYRYWRFSHLTASGGSHLALGALQLRDSGDAILSVTFSTSMTSAAGAISNLNENSLYAPGVYFDVSQLTPGDTRHITADLGSAQSVVGIRAATWNNTSQRLSTFRLSGSNDNTTYTVINTTVTLPAITTTETLQASTTTVGSPLSPDFGASERGEIALWNSVAYVCTASGNPGTWLALN